MEDDGQFEVPITEQQAVPLQATAVLALSDSQTITSLSVTKTQTVQAVSKSQTTTVSNTQTTTVSNQSTSLQSLPQIVTALQQQAGPHGKDQENFQDIPTAAQAIDGSNSPQSQTRHSEPLAHNTRDAVQSPVRGEEPINAETAGSTAQRGRRSKRKGLTKRTSGKPSSPTPKPVQQESPRTRSGTSQGGKRAKKAGPSPSPPPAKRTRRATQRLAEGEKHPLEWGVEEVADFISGTPHSSYTSVFREHVSGWT